MARCNHPFCTRITKRSHCGRHWHELPEDLQNRLKHASSVDEKRHLLLEARTWFEQERMIGRHEISTCRGRAPNYEHGCGADIVWLPTKANKNMPVDVAGVEADDLYYEHGKHTSHWATCPNAEKHRR